MTEKMVTNFGQFEKLKCREGSRLCKLSQLCYHFLSLFKNENKFFYIPRHPPPIAVRNSLTNQIFQKKLWFCIFSFKKSAKLKRRDGSQKNLSLFFWKYTETLIFRKNWLVNEFRTAMGGELLRISKKKFHIRIVCKDPKTRKAVLDHFWAKIPSSGTTSLSSLVLRILVLINHFDLGALQMGIVRLQKIYTIWYKIFFVASSQTSQFIDQIDWGADTVKTF